MVATFCLRLACGLILFLPILPTAVVPPRFYRVQFLFALAMLAVAAIFLGDAAGPAFWIAWTAAAAGCVAGSIVWHVDEAPGGQVVIWVTPPLLLVCLILGGLAAYPADAVGWR